jgi:hypothetical protein
VLGSTEFAEALQCRLSTCAVASGHDDACAVTGELFCRDQTDPGGRASDDDDLVSNAQS